jgi:deoxyadenosine/deoxycytidine kinase
VSGVNGFRGKVIVVEGLIGAGKSCFSEELGGAMFSYEEKKEDETGREVPRTLVFTEPDERDEANPYLKDYYEDSDRWAFTMQVHLLQARLKIHLDAQWYAMNRNGNAVIDRPFYGDTAFARLQLQRGHLDERQFGTYAGIYHAMTANVLLPVFCVWLWTTPETSLRRINQRLSERAGRTCESGIEISYLQQLNEAIEHMVAVLEASGVQIIKLDWNQDRDQESRLIEILSVQEEIRSYQPPDPFLDLHRRTV